MELPETQHGNGPTALLPSINNINKMHKELLADYIVPFYRVGDERNSRKICMLKPPFEPAEHEWAFCWIKSLLRDPGTGRTFSEPLCFFTCVDYRSGGTFSKRLRVFYLRGSRMLGERPPDLSTSSVMFSAQETKKWLSSAVFQLMTAYKAVRAINGIELPSLRLILGLGQLDNYAYL